MHFIVSNLPLQIKHQLYYEAPLCSGDLVTGLEVLLTADPDTPISPFSPATPGSPTSPFSPLGPCGKPRIEQRLDQQWSHSNVSQYY